MSKNIALINRDCIAMIDLFKRQPSQHDFADFVFWASQEDNLLNDWEKFETYEDKYDFMAKRFLDGLENEWCVAFLEALIRQAQIKIKEHWEWVKEKKDQQ